MQTVQLKPTFVKTKNVRNFIVMMDGLALGAGEGRLGMVFGQAGRGKTRTSQWYAAHNDCVYLRIATIWRTSEVSFLNALANELRIASPAKRKGPAFTEVIDTLLANPRPVFLDEIEKLPKVFLDLIRDLSDMSTAPFVLVGEEELVSVMRQNRRVWSRTYQQIEFKPLDEAAIIVYVKEASGLQVSAKVASIMHQASGGDFRIVRRGLLNLAHVANSKGVTDISEEDARIAMKIGLSPE